jgi:hypothetical protein
MKIKNICLKIEETYYHWLLGIWNMNKTRDWWWFNLNMGSNMTHIEAHFWYMLDRDYSEKTEK